MEKHRYNIIFVNNESTNGYTLYTIKIIDAEKQEKWYIKNRYKILRKLNEVIRK